MSVERETVGKQIQEIRELLNYWRFERDRYKDDKTIYQEPKHPCLLIIEKLEELQYTLLGYERDL